MTSIACCFKEHDDPFNIYEYLKKLEFISNGVFSSIKTSIDRIAISFRDDGFVTFDLIKGSLDYRFPFVNCKKGKKGHIVYRYKDGSSNIFLVKYPYNPDRYRNWNLIALTDPNASLQTKIKDILETHIEKQSHMSLSQVENPLDFFNSDNKDIKMTFNILNHHSVLRNSQENSFNQYVDTFYQGKNGNARKGSKGSRSYTKTENDETFSRIELQANRLLLKKLGLNVSSLPIEPEDINPFQYIEPRQGLNASSLDKLSTTLAKRKHKSTRDNPNFSNISLSSFKDIYSILILAEMGCHSPSDLSSVPVAKQINIFKKFRREAGITNQVDQFFPKMTWEELFSLIKEALPCKEDPLIELKGINLPEIQILRRTTMNHPSITM